MVESDLLKVAAIMNGLAAKYDDKTRNDTFLRLKWFVVAGCGDYRGHVDNGA